MVSFETKATDYPIEALDILLDRDCVSERYYPLVAQKEKLISALIQQGCKTKRDAELLPDSALMQDGLQAEENVRLFRRFLTIYDEKPQKYKEIERICKTPNEAAAFHELYFLPGVKQIRATLYYRSGFRSLKDIAGTTVEDVITKTSAVIAENRLSCTVPLPKEVRTHIAVAKAFTMK